MVSSLIQLPLANQSHNFPISGLEKMEVSLDGIKICADFEVTEILDNKDPYPVLLGIDWAYDIDAIASKKARLLNQGKVVT